MSEIKISIFREDLYDNYAYIGAQLCLPATSAEIQDALERARIDVDHPDFKVLDYELNQGYLNELLPQKVSLDELNYLAQRLCGMNNFEKAAYEGVVKMEQELDIIKLINLTYNLDNCQVVFEANNDQQLGRFYVENDFIDELTTVSDEVLQYIDYEKVGRSRREAEKGVFISNGYVVRDQSDIRIIYDGTNIPKHGEETGYIFELYLIKSCYEPEKAEGVWLKLPAAESEIAIALSNLDASIEECIFTHCKSNMSCFNDMFSENEDIEMLNTLSNAISKIIDNNMSAKYKAVLQYEDCTDLGLAIDITQNLDCYSFYPFLSSPEDYGRQLLIDSLKFSLDDVILNHIDLRGYGEDMMKADGVQATDYGLICRNEKEFVFQFCQKLVEQQMI